MNKRLILLSVRGTFTEWGPGCLLNIVTLTDETVNQFAVGVRTGGEWVVLSRHADEKTASGKTVVWLQAILAATDGGLLYWDSDKQQVVDELAEDTEAFADGHLVDTLPDVSETATTEAQYAVGFRNRDGVWTRVHPDDPHFRAAVRRHNATGLLGWFDSDRNYWQIDVLEAGDDALSNYLAAQISTCKCGDPDCIAGQGSANLSDPASSAVGSVALQAPLRSEPVFRQGATPWTPSPYYAVPGMDGGRLVTRSMKDVLR